MKNWNLNESNFTFSDRLKVCSFFLSPRNFWTMSSKVQEFEAQMAMFTKSKYALFVSSGSAANSILASYLKDYFYVEGEDNIIIFPSTTWITSVSPFIREGFTPKFIDISLSNYSMRVDHLEEYIKQNRNKIRCIFPTSLLGFNADIENLLRIQNEYGIKIMLDNCENTFGDYNMKNISSYFTSTTSTYFGHQLQSVEGGFIFTNSKEERDLFLMYRNHGMTRSVRDNEKYLNKNVDSKFDFYLLGNNYRNTDVHAFIGLLDFARVHKYISKRLRLYNFFKSTVKKQNIILPVKTDKNLDVPFCLPLLFNNQYHKKTIQKYCSINNIESRPIVSGNLLRQTCLQKYSDHSIYTNSEFIHENGFYIGLHNKVKEKQLEKLVNEINNLQ